MPTHPAFPLVCWLALALTLPRLTPLALLLVSLVGAVYLGRAVAFPFLKPVFPANTQTFWLVSSGICLVIGLIHTSKYSLLNWLII